ncbi:uncharacterized protein LOC131294569 [Anopheles ziemanni]|uniref:uncharacterized protein LOC131265194 n=1 Tax=Anopheles coustani TaxID=139045 RepID=UPI00265A3114|nr:uncharacterized protein LOC131265194 [Anopheles coustani]XP_058178597.1 uncharacterized protein LOC131294569 [Anopheles ziemanni]
MKITMLKLFALLSTGCVLLGVTLAAETNKRQSQGQQQQLGRYKRGLLSALFGGGTGGEEPPRQAMEVPPAEVLPIYGDPAKPPLHMLYGHATGLAQGPYPPYPVMFIPGAAHYADGARPGPYLPVLSYGGVGAGDGALVHPAAAAGDSNYLPAVIGWPEASSPQPTEAIAETSSSKPTVVDQGPKSEYLQKLNLSPADEAELKRLSKQLGVTDFEHLPPFEDVMALLGTTTSEETIKAIKEYASTPDGLELIKDYVMSYQPAKRVSLGQEPYTEGNGVEDDVPEAQEATTPATPDIGFFARQFRRLKSLLTFGYYGGTEDEVPVAQTPTGTTLPVEQVQVTSEATPFVVRNEFPAFEVRDGGVREMPVAHYIIPVRALPPHPLSYAPDHRYASSVPFPLALHYPPESQYPNPFTVRSAGEQAIVPSHEEPTVTTTTPTPPPTIPNDAIRREPTVAPQRAAPPTLPTGEVHTFERADLDQAERTTTPSPTGPVTEVSKSTVEPAGAPRVTLGPIVVEPELLDTTELSTNTLDEQ